MYNMNHALAPLYQRRVFRSDKKVDCHDQVARELSGHDIRWKGNNVDTVLFKAKIHRLEIFMLKYGAEVVVTPEPFGHFVLAHMTLKGIAEIESDGRRIVIPQGNAALLSPRKTLRMWWQAGSEQLILKIPASLFNEMSMPEGSGDGMPPPVHLLSRYAMPQWNFLLQSLLGVLALPGELGDRATWIDHIERSAVQFLKDQFQKMAVPHPSDIFDTTAMSGASLESLSGADDIRRLNVLEQYLWTKLCAPVSLVDMANAAGVSVRWLNVLCQKHHGVTPAILLRNKRLDAARAHLTTCSDANVTEAAFEFGFSHLGRFSAYYNERFGELPRQTLTRCHN
jgi:AraC-like DNA-binding protein